MYTQSLLLDDQARHGDTISSTCPKSFIMLSFRFVKSITNALKYDQSFLPISGYRRGITLYGIIF